MGKRPFASVSQAWPTHGGDHPAPSPAQRHEIVLWYDLFVGTPARACVPDASATLSSGAPSARQAASSARADGAVPLAAAAAPDDSVASAPLSATPAALHPSDGPTTGGKSTHAQVAESSTGGGPARVTVAPESGALAGSAPRFSAPAPGDAPAGRSTDTGSAHTHLAESGTGGGRAPMVAAPASDVLAESAALSSTPAVIDPPLPRVTVGALHAATPTSMVHVDRVNMTRLANDFLRVCPSSDIVFLFQKEEMLRVVEHGCFGRRAFAALMSEMFVPPIGGEVGDTEFLQGHRRNVVEDSLAFWDREWALGKVCPEHSPGALFNDVAEQSHGAYL